MINIKTDKRCHVPEIFRKVESDSDSGMSFMQVPAGITTASAGKPAVRTPAYGNVQFMILQKGNRRRFRLICHKVLSSTAQPGIRQLQGTPGSLMLSKDNIGRDGGFPQKHHLQDPKKHLNRIINQYGCSELPAVPLPPVCNINVALKKKGVPMTK